MKPLLSLLFSFVIALTSFGQNGVYVYGFMENAPDESVAVDVTIFADSAVTGVATLFTESSGSIPVIWVDLPEGFEISWISAAFIDCHGSYYSEAWGANEFDNLVDVPINLNYCQNTLIFGCTDPEALNYNPNATMDDGSCEYTADCDLNEIIVIINTVYWANEISWSLFTEGASVANGGNYQNQSSSLSSHCVPDGCYIFEMHDTYGDGWNNATFKVVLSDNTILASGTLSQGSFGTVTFGINQEDCPEVIYGCTDPEAVNYNPTATHDSGTCTYPIENDICQDAQPILPGIILVDNTNAVVNVGIWGECWGFGQGEGEQSSVWYSFTTPDYPARIHFEALYDGTHTLTDTQFGIFEECGGDMIFCDGNGGQGLMSAFDFECGDLAENTTYILMIDGWNGNAGTCLLEYTVDSTCTDPIYGCMDPDALNYNPDATHDAGSCEYEIECDLNSIQVIINTQSWAYEISWYLLDVDGGTVGSGSGYDNYTESMSQWCLEDGCYSFFMIDSFGDGWNGATYKVLLDGEILITGTLNNGDYGWRNFGINQQGCSYTDPISGCTDPESLNYNPNATVDDGSCQYEIECDFNAVQVVINTQFWANEISWNLLNADSISVASGDGYDNDTANLSQWCLEDGCYTFLMYDSYGDGWNGSTFEIITSGETLAFGALSSGNYGFVSFGINQDGCVYAPPVYGCTDPEALNYNPNATDDNGLCQYPIDCDLNTVQIITQVSGSDISWNLLNADSIPVAGGTVYGNNTEYLSQWCLEDGCYTFGVFETSGYGWNGFNFVIVVGGDTLTSGTLNFGNSASIDFGINQEGCVFIPPVYGCTDPEALNYNPDALIDDGSCEYSADCDLNEIIVILNTNGSTNEISWYLRNADSFPVAWGQGGYGNNPEYLSQLCLEDGCYTFEMFEDFGDGWSGCSFWIVLGGDTLASGTFNFGNSGSIDFGINQEGCNGASTIYGCTDPESINYNPDATEDDGSCTYEFGCSIDFLVIPDSTGEDIIWILPSDNIFDVIEILWDFGDGTTSTDLFPQHEYSGDGPYTLCVTASFQSPDSSTCSITYCAVLSGNMVGGSGFVAGDGGFSINVINNQEAVGIDEPKTFTNLNLWPNPASEQLNIKYHTSISATQAISILDITGKTLIQDEFGVGAGEFTKAVDVSNLPSGVYLLRLTADDHVEAKRFVIAK